MTNRSIISRWFNREDRRLVEERPHMDCMPRVSKIYYSNAKWSKIGNSQDSHNNWDDPALNKHTARIICQRLMEEYGNIAECDIRGKCLEVWVTDEKGCRV